MLGEQMQVHTTALLLDQCNNKETSDGATVLVAILISGIFSPSYWPISNGFTNFVSMHWMILFTSFSSLSFLCDLNSLWKLEPAEVPLITLKDAVAAAIIWAVSAHLSLVPSMPVTSTIPLGFWNLCSMSAKMPYLVRKNLRWLGRWCWNSVGSILSELSVSCR